VRATLSGVQQTQIPDIGRVKISSRKISPCHTTTTTVGVMKKEFWKQNHFEGTAVIPICYHQQHLSENLILTHHDTFGWQTTKQSWILHKNFWGE
jgi:hypothetical protein